MLSAASARCIGHSHCRSRLDVCADADGTQYMHVQCTTFRLQLMSGASSTLTASAACVRAASCMYVYRAVSVATYTAVRGARVGVRMVQASFTARGSTYVLLPSFIHRPRPRRSRPAPEISPGAQRRSGGPAPPLRLRAPLGWGLRLVRRRSSFYRPYNGYSNRHLDRCTQRN